MTPAELLRKAASLLADESQWRKGWESETNRGLCAGDAIAAAAGFDGTGSAISKETWALVDEARRQFHEAAGTDCVVSFNDAETTTHAMVLGVFDRAAKAAS